MVETNDSGPWQTDVFWLLIGQDVESGCVVPQGAIGAIELLERLQALPDFNNDSFIAAMESTENKRFLCWEAAPSSEAAVDR
ncbi:MAG: hypothetical protein KDA44_07815 [Planctomycetales bacterium]|nr:hypothetical protein [Planctomycetales bacterium]